MYRLKDIIVLLQIRFCLNLNKIPLEPCFVPRILNWIFPRVWVNSNKYLHNAILWPKKIPRSYIHYVLSFLEQILQNKILYIIYNSCYSLVDNGNYWNSTCFSRHRTTIIIVEEINILECIWGKIIFFVLVS